ncbi:MAG: hypothetical protein AB7E21_03205 [Pseudodonghicola sp.]
MKKISAVILSLSAFFLSGCAKKAEDIQASYISPLAYKSFSCRQIQEEGTRISQRAGQVAGVQNKKASDDAVATGVAIVLFWPAAFFIKGDQETAGELARLKGELDALEQTSIQKNCGIVFKKEPAPEE